MQELTARNIVHSQKIYEKDYVSEIISYINENDLKAGDKLPSNLALAEHYGVSVSQIRTALIKLESLGIVEIQSRSGCFVKSLDVNMIIKLFSLFLQQAVSENIPGLLFVYELKTVLDAELFSMGASTRTDIELYELNQLLQKQKEAFDNKEEFVMLDEQYHEKVAEMTRNPLLLILYKTIHSMIRSDRIRNSKSTREYREKVYKDHEKLYETIKNKDTEKAMQFAREHAQRRLKTLLAEK